MRSYFRRLTFIAIAATLAHGCSSSTSTVEQSGNYVTPTSALDVEMPADMLQHLIDSSTTNIGGAYQKGGHPIQWLGDSSSNMVTYAKSLVNGTHIPYVWGGKHIDKPTEWASPNKAGQCAARVGLDCSGFVSLVLAHAGFKLAANEVNVYGLVNSVNWEPVRKRGYEVTYFIEPQVKDLLPGDILIFQDSIGRLVHTGMFWDQKASLPTGVSPAFFNAMGHAKCADTYEQEAAGKQSGVVATALGPYWSSHLLMYIRVYNRNFMKFKILGNEYVNHSSTAPAAPILDTTTNEFLITAYDDSSETAKMAALIIHAENVTGKGTFTIPERTQDSIGYSEIYVIPKHDSIFNADSISYYVTPPPKWWHGDNPPATGGQIKVTSFAHDKNYGTIAGTFDFKANAYFSRYEDSTYYIDTAKYTTTVKRYYVNPTRVTGSFEGLMGLQ